MIAVPLAFLDVGGFELLMIMLLVLILFGGKRMPEIAKGMGKAVRELKKATGSVETEFRRAMDEVDVQKILTPPEEKKPETREITNDKNANPPA